MQTPPLISRLDLLRSAKNQFDLANLLGVKIQFFTHVLYAMKDSDRYKNFEIEKASGGKRQISVPHPKLLELQKRLSKLLYECREIAAKKEGSVGASSHGFERNKDIFSNASKHVSRKFVFNTDLENFFGSIHIGRIIAVLQKDRNFKLNCKVAQMIGQISCYNGVLPQGAPTSPILANIIGDILDRRIRKFANFNKCSYSRYADDLTFSTNRPNFPTAVACEIKKTGEWKVGKELEDIISRSGFSINAIKTRMYLSGSQQNVSGLIVNDTISVNMKYRRLTRAMCHSLFNTGKYHLQKSSKIQEYNFTNLKPLLGRASHMVNIAKKRRIREDKIISSENIFLPRKRKYSNDEKLFESLIYFQNIVAPKEPVIITEGFTDYVYLKKAGTYKSTVPKSLLAPDGLLKIKFFNPTSSRRHYLQLGDGASQIKNFIFKYAMNNKRYKVQPHPKPIICIVDSDKAGLEVWNPCKNNSQSVNLDEHTIMVKQGLYLIKLSHLKDDSIIEDYISSDLKLQKIKGKVFEVISNSGNTYTKGDFANYVIPKHSEEKHFQNFIHIFNSINLCNIHFQETFK